MLEKDLIDLACQARDRAYAPYSGYRVGAALQADGGQVYLGCNVENSSYGLTICAERAAVAAAVAAGNRHFVRIAVVSSGKLLPVPCGACRQVLYEFAPHLEVICVSSEETRIFSLQELLPEGFRLNTPGSM